MATENEIEELQLQLESKVCGLGVDVLAKLAEHLQVETKELGRLALSKKIGEQIEHDLSEPDAVGRFNCVCEWKTTSARR